MHDALRGSTSPLFAPWRALALFGALVFLASPAGALSLVGTERSLLAEAEAFSVSDFDARFDESAAPDAGPYSDSVSASAAVEGVSGNAQASQTSSLADEVLATGAASAEGSATADVFGAGTFAAESFFAIVLEDVTSFELDASLDSLVNGGDGFASLRLLELRDGEPDLVVLELEAQQGEEAEISTAGLLDPNATYLLRARALAVSLVDEFGPMAGGSASYDLRFVAVPEAGTTLLLFGACLALRFCFSRPKGAA